MYEWTLDKTPRPRIGNSMSGPWLAELGVLPARRILPNSANRLRSVGTTCRATGRETYRHCILLDIRGAVIAQVLDCWGRSRARALAREAVAMRPRGMDLFDHLGRHSEAFEGLPPRNRCAGVRAFFPGAFAARIDDGDFKALAAPWCIR